MIEFNSNLNILCDAQAGQKGLKFLRDHTISLLHSPLQEHIRFVISYNIIFDFKYLYLIYDDLYFL